MEKPSYTELVETLDELLGSIPPRHSYPHEEERFDEMERKAKTVLARAQRQGRQVKKVVVTVSTEGTKVRVTVNGSPLVNCDPRDYFDGATGRRQEARKDAEHLARISVEAMRLAGLEVEATSHGYNL